MIQNLKKYNKNGVWINSRIAPYALYVDNIKNLVFEFLILARQIQ